MGLTAEQQRWLDSYLQNAKDFGATGPELYSAGPDLAYESQDLADVERLGPSAYAGIRGNDRAQAAQEAALAALEERSRTGLTPQDEADWFRLQSEVNRANAGRLGAIQQNMAARGISGSGQNAALQLQAAQDAGEREALFALEKAGQANENKFRAAQAAGELGGSIRRQQFSEEAQKAQASDLISRFNNLALQKAKERRITNANEARLANYNRANAISDQNVNEKNRYRKENLGVQQDAAQAGYDAATEAENRRLWEKEEARKRRMARYGAIGGILTGAGAAYASGGNPQAAQAGFQAGNAAGSAAGESDKGPGGYGFNFAHGGQVPCYANGGMIDADYYPDESEQYAYLDDIGHDTQLIAASPGEVVVPRSVVAATAANPASNAPTQFVKEAIAAQPTPTPTPAAQLPVAAQPEAQTMPSRSGLERSFAMMGGGNNPYTDFARNLRGNVESAKQRIGDAESGVTYAEYGDIAGDAANRYFEGTRHDIAYHNPFKTMGSAPTIKQGYAPKFRTDLADDARKDVASAVAGLDRTYAMAAKDEALMLREREADPNSIESQIARDLAKKFVPKANVDGASAAQLKSALPMMEKAYLSEIQKRGAAGNKGFKGTVIGEDGKRHYAWIDPITKEVWQAPEVAAGGEGGAHPQLHAGFVEGDVKGVPRYFSIDPATQQAVPIPGVVASGVNPQVKLDPVTGAYVQLVPGTGAVGTGTSGSPSGTLMNPGTGQMMPPQAPGTGTQAPPVAPAAPPVQPKAPRKPGGPRPGETPAEYKRRRDLEESRKKKKQEEGVKKESLIKDAEAQAAGRRAYTEDLMGLRAAAKQEGWVGPMNGRLAAVYFATNNTPNGPDGKPAINTARLRIELMTGLNNYIQKMTGAGLSEKEATRLGATQPDMYDDDTYFEQKLRATMDEADKIINERRIAAGLEPSGSMTKIPKGGLKNSQSKQSDPELDAARKWLADPKNRKDKNYDAVLAKVQKMIRERKGGS